MQAVYTNAQIRLIEKQAIKMGISGDTMMQAAGEAAFALLKKKWPQAQKIAIVCGGGNNGGDGWILATCLKQQGLDPIVYSTVDLQKLQHKAKNAYEKANAAGVTCNSIEKFKPKHYELIVDALLGIGITDQARDDAQYIISLINSANKPVLAIDIPSGLCADRGVTLPNAVNATATITFIGFKSGLVTAYAADHCGEIQLHRLNLPDSLYREITPPIHTVCYQDFKQYLTPRKASSHKGDFGHVLIIGGNKGMMGAANLAGLGALRSGAGLVSVATHPHHAALLNITQPEIMCHGIDKAKDILPLLQKASVLILGPGLGNNDWAKALFKCVIKNNTKPIILDADALNLLAKMKVRIKHAIITPHPGEAARLLSQSNADIQEHRWQSTITMQKQYAEVCVLKGKGTIIYDGEHSFVCTEGNPGMASGGMGDLLSGIIAGLLAQKLDLSTAAALGVCLHAKAGDIAAKTHGTRGLLASDLLLPLRTIVNL